MASPSAQDLIDLGISRGHAYDILAGRQDPSLPLALQIYAATGAQFGILRGMTAKEIAPLQRQIAA